jgi:hypothetical protein
MVCVLNQRVACQKAACVGCREGAACGWLHVRGLADVLQQILRYAQSSCSSS